MSADAIEVTGPFRGTTGYDRHTRELVRHLVAQGVRVQLTHLDGWSPQLPPSLRETWLDELSAPVDAKLALHFTMPNHCRPRPDRINVNYTMFEADRIPRDWVARAAAHERIVVPTPACLHAWTGSGVPAEKVRISPLGVDGAFFEQRVAPPQLLLPDGRAISSFSVRFLNIAELRPRKNHLGLLRAWIRATRRDDDAVLILKCSAFQPAALELFRADVSEMQRRHGRSLADAAPLVIISGLLPEHEIRALYAAATHYISMSFGEGWDQPMMEAAASGLALIAPRHTAYCSYLTDEDTELLDAPAVPVTFEGRTGAEDIVFFKDAQWWRPDEEAAVEVIRRVIRTGGPTKPSPRERIVRDYSWSRAAARLREVLDELV